MSLETSMKIVLVLTAYDRISKVVSNATSANIEKLSRFSKKAEALAEKSFKTGQQLMAAGLAIGAPLYKAVDAATEFESKMIDIRKQMAIDNPETVKAMTRDVFNLGRQLPLATGEIQDMVAAGLRMGIAQDQIISYTKDVSKMAVAFEIPAGEIADSMGKISNVFKIPISKVGEFADAINYLDDNTQAKGPELIDVLQRIGGVAKSLSPNNAAALASTMLSIGESAETSSTAINGMMIQLSAANMQSGKFQQGIAMLGIDANKLQNSMASKDTAQFAILEVFEKINKLPVQKQTEALIRLFGKEQGPKLAKLANNIAEYRRQLELVKGKEKGSMDSEYQKRMEGSAAKMQTFKNRLHEVSVKFGTALLPALHKAINFADRWLEKISGFMDAHPGLVAGLGKAAAIVSALALAGGYLSFVFGGIFKLFSIGSRVITFLTQAFNVLRVVFGVLRVLILAFPLLGWVLAIAGVAFLLIRNWTQVKKFFQNMIPAIVAYFRGLISPLMSIGKTVFNIITWPVRAVLSFLKGTYEAYTAGGKGIIESIISGIKAAIHVPVELVKNMLQKVRNLLPFSPAKDGPLKDLHRTRIMETITESVTKGAGDKLKKKVASELNLITGFNAGNTSVAGNGNSGAGFSMTVNLTLNGSASQKDADLLSATLKREFNRLMDNYNAQKRRVSFGY